LIACKSFIKALLSGFQRDAGRSRASIVDGLNGLRPMLRDRCPCGSLCSNNIPEAAPEGSLSFSVSEKLARYVIGRGTPHFACR
jgi:hypothetical protein